MPAGEHLCSGQNIGREGRSGVLYLTELNAIFITWWEGWLISMCVGRMEGDREVGKGFPGAVNIMGTG